MSRVVLVYCDDYSADMVTEAVRKGVDLLGGIDRFVKKDEKILLKPNMLTGDRPEKCVTTHPSVFKAVAGLFLEGGARLTYGDSPAYGSSLAAAKGNGLHEAAESMGVPMADFKNGEEIFFKDGRQNRKFIIAKGVLESDAVISLPKFKTHGLEKFTGAVKNQFGCVPGVRKGEYHVKLVDPDEFGKMLLDLNAFVCPRLYIMDGIQAMEGNGPRGGRPINMNVILLSDDPVAMDATACRLIGLDPMFVPTVRYGEEAGLGIASEKNIEILGQSPERFRNLLFDVDRKPVKPFPGSKIVKAVKNRLLPRPVIREADCIKCGVCVKMCPVEGKAVDWENGDRKKPPVYDYKKCIRCYCCQEMCPESAIVLKKPVIRKLFRF